MNKVVRVMLCGIVCAAGQIYAAADSDAAGVSSALFKKDVPVKKTKKSTKRTSSRTEYRAPKPVDVPGSDKHLERMAAAQALAERRKGKNALVCEKTTHITLQRQLSILETRCTPYSKRVRILEKLIAHAELSIHRIDVQLKKVGEERVSDQQRMRLQRDRWHAELKRYEDRKKEYEKKAHTEDEK